MDFDVPADQRMKIEENKKRKTFLDSAIDGDNDSNCNWCAWNDLQRLHKWVVGAENWRTKWNPPNYSIIEIDQNKGMSPGDLKTLAVTQTQEKYHQLTQQLKILEEQQQQQGTRKNTLKREINVITNHLVGVLVV